MANTARQPALPHQAPLRTLTLRCLPLDVQIYLQCTGHCRIYYFLPTESQCCTFVYQGYPISAKGVSSAGIEQRLITESRQGVFLCKLTLKEVSCFKSTIVQADPSTGRSEAGDSPAGGVEYEKGTSREAAKGLPLNQTMQHGKSQHIHVSAPLAAQDPPDSRRPHGSPEGGEALTGVNMIAAGQSGDALAGGTAEVEKTLQRLNALSIRTSPTFSDTRSKSL